MKNRKLDNEAWAFILDIVKNGKGEEVVTAIKEQRKAFLDFLASDQAAEDDFAFHLWGIEAMTTAIDIWSYERGEK